MPYTVVRGIYLYRMVVGGNKQRRLPRLHFSSDRF